MGWYKQNNQLYWTCSLSNYNRGLYLAEREPPNLNECEKRVIKKTDQSIGNFVMGLSNGQQFYYHSYLTDDQEITNVIFQGKFPEYPTWKNLSQIVPSLKSAIVETGLTLTHNRTDINLLCYSDYILGWAENSLRFDITLGIAPEKLISYYEKYAGKAFKFDKTNLKVKTEKTNWLSITSGLTFDNLEPIDLGYNRVVTGKYERAKKVIDNYLDWITPKTIVDLYGSVNREEFVSSRCMGCQRKDMGHMLLNVHRKELPFFVITEIYQVYKNGEQFDSTYNLIEKAKANDKSTVNDFKEMLGSFLMECFISPTEILYPRLLFHKNSNYWGRKNSKKGLAFPGSEPLINGSTYPTGIIFNAQPSVYNPLPPQEGDVIHWQSGPVGEPELPQQLDLPQQAPSSVVTGNYFESPTYQHAVQELKVAQHAVQGLNKVTKGVWKSKESLTWNHKFKKTLT